MAPLRSHRGTRGGPRAHDPRRWRASEAVDAVGICLTRRLGGVARVAVSRSAAGSIADQLRHRLGAACLGHPPGRGTSALPGRDGGTALSVSEHALCSGVAHAPPHPRRGAPRGLNRSLRVFRSRGGAAEGHGGRLEGRWGRALNRAARQPAACAAHRSALGRVHGRALARMHAWSPLSLEPAASSEHRTLQNTRWHGIYLLSPRGCICTLLPWAPAPSMAPRARARRAAGRRSMGGSRAIGLLAQRARGRSLILQNSFFLYSISLSPNHLAAQIITD